jgi:hypothetical protein
LVKFSVRSTAAKGPIDTELKENIYSGKIGPRL